MGRSFERTSCVASCCFLEGSERTGKAADSGDWSGVPEVGMGGVHRTQLPRSLDAECLAAGVLKTATFRLQCAPHKRSRLAMADVGRTSCQPHGWRQLLRRCAAHLPAAARPLPASFLSRMLTLPVSGAGGQHIQELHLRRPRNATSQNRPLASDRSTASPAPQPPGCARSAGTCLCVRSP